MRARKNNSKKLTVVLLSIILVLCCTIGGTLAWLTAESETVTNTFTVGNITIELKEHELKTDGTLDASKEVSENENYKVVPGDTQPKDPFVRVKQGSEKCYVYVLVTNNLVIDNKAVATCNIYNNWEAIGTKDNSTLYRSNAIVDAGTSDQLVQVFSTVSYDGTEITETNINSLKDKTIVIDAYAHQSENTTQDVADAAAKAHFGITDSTT